MSTSIPTGPARPTPLQDSARAHAPIPAALGMLIAGASIVLVLYRADAGVDVVNIVAAAAATLAAPATAITTLSRVLAVAYNLVTPTEAPRNDASQVLVPRDSVVVSDLTERVDEITNSVNDILTAVGADDVRWPGPRAATAPVPPAADEPPPRRRARQRWEPGEQPGQTREWPPARRPSDRGTTGPDPTRTGLRAVTPAERRVPLRSVDEDLDEPDDDFGGGRGYYESDVDRARDRHPSARGSDPAVAMLSPGRHHQPDRAGRRDRGGRRG
jgi:hypothetical protein